MEYGFDFYCKLTQDIEVMKFFPKLLSHEEARGEMLYLNKQIKQYGYGFWAVGLKDMGECIGNLGISNVKFESFFTPAIEIGWHFHKKFWHQGFAEEALMVFDFMKDNKIDDKTIAFTEKVNLPSQAVVKSIEMNYLGDFIHPSIEDNSHILAPHVVYDKSL